MTSGRWLGTGMRATHGTTWWQLSAASNPQLCYWSTSSGVKRIRVANACESFLNVGTKTCCGLLLPQFFCKTSRCFVAPLNSLLRRRQQWPMPYLITEISCCHLNSEVSVTPGSKPHFDFLDIVFVYSPFVGHVQTDWQAYRHFSWGQGQPKRPCAANAVSSAHSYWSAMKTAGVEALPLPDPSIRDLIKGKNKRMRTKLVIW